MEKTLKLTLACASPRRHELLKTLGYDFNIIVPKIDETPLPKENPRTYAERLAQEKAYAVTSTGVVIAADTIVVNQKKILEKPVDAAQARAMLRSLSGMGHEVITGVCIKNADRTFLFSVVTQVFFRPLEKDEIDAYVASGDPMDKAGAYAIQGGAAHMIHAINGSYTNVVGLPLSELHAALLSF